MARCGCSCESRFRQNFNKSSDWMAFNAHFVNTMSNDRIVIAIDTCLVPKSGKETPGLCWFWSGCASAKKRGLEFLGLSVIDAAAKEVVFLKAEQTFNEKCRAHKPKCTKSVKDPDSLSS